jgi:hypothetical protein
MIAENLPMKKWRVNRSNGSKRRNSSSEERLQKEK